MDCLSMSVKYSSVSPVFSVGKNSHYASHLLVGHCKFGSPSKRAAIRSQCVTHNSRYAGLEMHIDESDCDECAMAACVLRSAYRRSSRSPHSGYHCDLKHIGEQLRVSEKVFVKLEGFFSTLFSRGYTRVEAYKTPSTINKSLLSIYITKILPSVTAKTFVKPSTLMTYSCDILLLQCLSTAIYAGIDMAETAYKSNSSFFDRVVLANDREQIFKLLSNSNYEKSLKERLKFLEKKLVKKVRGIKVERLPKHYVLTDFYMGFVPKEQKNLGVVHIMNKF